MQLVFKKCIPGQPSEDMRYGGSLQVVSMKFNRTPRLHSLLLFLQLLQSGVPSSHLRCLSLQVKQPVRTLLLFAGAGLAEGTPAAAFGEGGLSSLVNILLLLPESGSFFLLGGGT